MQTGKAYALKIMDVNYSEWMVSGIAESRGSKCHSTVTLTSRGWTHVIAISLSVILSLWDASL